LGGKIEGGDKGEEEKIKKSLVGGVDRLLSLYYYWFVMITKLELL
jgi:hypothetical protein